MNRSAMQQKVRLTRHETAILSPGSSREPYRCRADSFLKAPLVLTAPSPWNKRASARASTPEWVGHFLDRPSLRLAKFSDKFVAIESVFRRVDCSL